MKARSTNPLGGTHFAGDVASGVDDGNGVKLGTAQSGSTVWIEPISDDADASIGIRAKGNGVVTIVDNAGTYNVKDYGAIGDGVADDTQAIQDTIDAVLGLSGGGVVLFPSGTYLVSELNLSNTVNLTPSQSLRLVGAGRLATRLVGTESGGILLDTIGRSYLSIEELRVSTGTVPYQTALLLARRTEGPTECRNIVLRNVRIDGSFTVGSVVALASEINHWSEVELCNDNATNGYCCFFTGLGNGRAGVTSSHGTPYESTNTFNVMHHVTFYTPYDNATPVIMDQGAGYTFVGCSVQASNKTGVKCVTYVDAGGGPGGGFVGPVNWIGALWECGQASVHYLSTDGIALGRYQFIHDRNSSYTLFNASAANYVVQTNGVPTILARSTIRDIRFVGGAGGTLGLTVEYTSGCDFDLWSPAFATTITVTVARSSSRFKASTLTLPATETDDTSFPALIESDDMDVWARTLGVGTTPTSAQTAAIGGSRSAVSGFAWGEVITPTLVATANNDRLVALEIYPTFTAGAFTGVTKYAYWSEITDASFYHAGPMSVPGLLSSYKNATGTPTWQVYTSGDANPRIICYAGGTMLWGDGTNECDTSLRRLAANQLMTDDAWLCKRAVEPVTTTKSPSADESGEVYTNEGDADGATVTLPTATAGMEYSAYVQTGQTLTVTAAAGDTIRIGSSVTAAAGSITSNVVGSWVTLTAINATEWVGHNVVGSWSF